MLSFGKFYTRLEEVSHLYKGCTILRGGEEYTSKVCGYCLRIHEYLGTKKIFICPYGDCESHLLFGEDGVHRDESAAWKINMKMKLEYIFPPGDDKYNQWKYKKQVTLLWMKPRVFGVLSILILFLQLGSSHVSFLK